MLKQVLSRVWCSEKLLLVPRKSLFPCELLPGSGVAISNDWSLGKVRRLFSGMLNDFVIPRPMGLMDALVGVGWGSTDPELSHLLISSLTVRPIPLYTYREIPMKGVFSKQ